MGEVYLAFDSQLRRQVAIKLLQAEFTENKIRLARFEREAYAASSLNHPYIMTIHEIGEQNGRHFIATEYIEGESLRQHMTRQRMELRETLAIVSQMADALSAAHDAGIVHRDIKPENVMVRRDGYVKVLDFGLAKLAQETKGEDQINTEAPTRVVAVHTEPGMVMGTAHYMSPEQARGLEVDARSDIWSLGATLYEMAAGKKPFDGPTTTDVLAMILHREPPSLLLYQSQLPAELERIVEKALAKERDARYQTAKDLSVDLKRLKQRLEVDAELERSITPEEGARKTGARQGPGAAAGATVTGINSMPLATNEATGATHTLSSAEYVVNEIKRHKLAAMALFATIIVAAAAALIYYRYSSTHGVAISSVAVLPFTNQSGDPNMDYLSDGISESLINNLSQLSSLKVISRGSAFKYKGKEIDPQDVARALGVQAIVTGRVMQHGDQLQVSAELVNVSDKTQMWGEQFNRKVTDTLAVQTEISQQIAEKLRLRLTNAEQQQLAKDVKVNSAAYEQLLKGRLLRQKGSSKENLERAIEYFNQAIAIDDHYALAYALLSEAYQQMMGNSFLDPKEGAQKAEAAARKALELDDGLAEAHSSIAGIKLNGWDWAGAEQEFKRAIELSPSNARAHSAYSDFLNKMSRQDQAISEIKRAMELDPLQINWRINMGYFLFFARRYSQAVEQLKTTLEMDKGNNLAHNVLGYVYTVNGQYNDGIAEYEEAIRVGGASTSIDCYLGIALAKAGRRSEAEAILKRLETTKEYVSPVELAVLYVGMDKKEEALAALERAYAAHDIQMQFLGIDPFLDSLRSEPRFKEIIRKVGLPH